MRRRLGALIIFGAILTMFSVVAESTEIWNSWPATNHAGKVLALDSEVWVAAGAWGGALVRWDKVTGEHRVFTRADGPWSTFYTGLAVGTDGAVFFAKEGIVTCYSQDGWRNWALPNAIGAAIAVDGRERVWARGWPDGPDGDTTPIACFNGESWSFGTLPFNAYAMCSDREGRIWFGGDGELICLEGDSITRYPSPDPGKGMLSFWCIVADERGRIWANEGNRFYVLDTSLGTWDRKDLPSTGHHWPVHQFDVDALGRVVIPEQDCGLLIFDGKDVSCYGRSDEELRGWAENVAVDPEGTLIWVTNSVDGLFLFDGTSFHTMSIDCELRAMPEAISEDMNGKVWLGGVGSRFGYFDNGSWRWPFDVYQSETGFSSIKDIALGQKGAMYLTNYAPGAPLNGLLTLDTEGMLNHSSLDQPALYVNIAIDTQGAVWVTDMWVGKVYQYCNGAWERLQAPGCIPWGPCYDIAADPIQGVWVSGWGPPLLYYDGSGWHHIPNIPGYLHFHSIAFDRDGLLWAASNDGIWSYDGVTCKQVHPDMEEGYAGDGDFEKVYIDKYNRKWFAGSKGVLMLDETEWHLINSNNSPLNLGLVRDFLVDTEDRTWFLADDGVAMAQWSDRAVQLAIRAEVERLASGENSTLRLTASCSNDIADLNADLYLWAELFDGTKVYLPRLSLEEHPIFTRLTIPNGFTVEGIEIWSADLTHLPTGHYVIKAVLTNHGCLISPLSNEASAEFDWQKG